MRVVSARGVLDVETDTRILIVKTKDLSNTWQPIPVVIIGTIQPVIYDVYRKNTNSSSSNSKNYTVPYAEGALAQAKLPEILLLYFDGECQN